MGVTKLQEALAPQRIIAIDTSIVVYLLDNHPRYVDLAAAVMEAIEQGRLHPGRSVDCAVESRQRAGAARLRALSDTLPQFFHPPARCGNRPPGCAGPCADWSPTT